MASDAVPRSVPVSLVHGSQAPIATPIKIPGGNSLPHTGKSAAGHARSTGAPAHQAGATSASTEPATRPDQAATAKKADIQAQLAQLNKYLNDSGRPTQFRMDPASRGQTIQEVNPATGEVIGEYSAAQFPELTRGLGVSGVLVDRHA
jgi:uncharacterized FlaG/YvyC family protein